MKKHSHLRFQKNLVAAGVKPPPYSIMGMPCVLSIVNAYFYVAAVTPPDNNNWGAVQNFGGALFGTA